jgi:hypothetical protein
MLNMTGTGRRTGLLLGVWTAAVVVIGGVLMSYHQPFVTPDARILSLGSTSQRGRWRALHIVSGSCVCSRRVMEHLLQRRPQAGLVEEILMIEGSEIPLAGTASLLNKLEAAGYTVSRLAAEAIPESSGLHGVPVLIYATPENKLAYLGGYGKAGDQDVAIYRQVRRGDAAEPLPVLGCAVGNRVRGRADPVGWKYRR